MTDWTNDEWSAGSYSYVPVGGGPDDMRQLALPSSDRVFFAGEHTVPQHFGTVHAAFMSGRRAAAEVLAAGAVDGALTPTGVLYGEPEITFLEQLWGDGFLSPGGPDEVGRTIADIPLEGTSVLDIGCGSGGATIALARDHGAASVIGIDVEGPVCAHARERVARAGLADRIEIRQVEPGPLPLRTVRASTSCSARTRSSTSRTRSRSPPTCSVCCARRLVRRQRLADRTRRRAVARNGRLHRRRGPRLRDGVTGPVPGRARRRRFRRHRVW